MTDGPGFKIQTDHRIQGSDLWAFNPAHVMVVEAGEVKSGRAAVFGDRSQVRDGCGCDYCTWVPT